MEEYTVLLDLCEKHPEIIDLKLWTYEVFCEAQTMVITRCFGTLPFLMMAPFADCANHHTVDNHFVLCNIRMSKRIEETR